MARRFDKLFHFHGGLHLPPNKALSTGAPIAPAPIPEELVLPLHQHIGESAEPLVEPGQHVLKGERLAAASGYVSAPLHAPTSGTVSAIEDRPVPHPSGLAAPCIILRSDGEDRWHDHAEPDHTYLALEPSQLRNRIRAAGIVGLGGAGFPSFIKMNPGVRHTVDLLVLNGAECEPYITCDDMLMRERAREIVGGLKVMRHAVQARDCVIGVEDNKPEAIAALRAAVDRLHDDAIQVVTIPTRYPAGGERQLIKVLTGLEVPSQGLPQDLGIVCHNVGTAAAVYEAVVRHRPLVSRVVTVTGRGVAAPRNLEVLLGTPIRDLIEHCGGYQGSVSRLLMGGPMMGFALHSDSLPVIKTTNCVLAASAEEMPRPSPSMPCIRCGACVEVCPADLLPQQLYWHAHARDFDKVQDYNLFDCIECGCCAHVCPSHLPLVQYYRFAKTEIWAQERERQEADLARQRHEFRLERIEREKRERAEKLKKKKKALNTGDGGDEDPKKAAIQAALARVKDKKAASDVQPRNVADLTDEQRAKIREVDERRRNTGARGEPGGGGAN